MASVGLIKEAAARYEKPFFIAGDMNSRPDEAFIKTLGKEFTILSPTEGATYPADKPTDLIDYIAIKNQFAKKIRIEDRTIIDEPAASDHRPICVDLTIETF